MQPLESLHSITTPEGLQFDLHPAGPYTRALAYLLDFAIQFAAVLFLLVAANFSMVKIGSWLTILLLFLIQWFYFIFFESLLKGQTPGKIAMNIQVVHQDGSPLSFQAAFTRNILRAADMMFYLFIIGLVTITASKAYQRLGDWAAGTLVVHRPSRGPKARFLHFDLVTPEPFPIPLTTEESKALVAYCHRFILLPRTRADELAKPILEALFAGKTFPEPGLELLKYGAWQAGFRSKQEAVPPLKKDGSL